MSLRELEDTGRSIEEWRGKLQDLVEKRTQVFFQQRECEIVLEEFEFLNETDVVMKQVGPTLIKQDLAEAKSNVTHRVDFITRQLSELESSLTDAQKKLSDLEQRFQQMQLPAK
jgi:prefoldin beta subunit